eukprot:SAG31_NODE_1788_length_7267_cov_6.640067_1_plen_347_part_00
MSVPPPSKAEAPATQQPSGHAVLAVRKVRSFIESVINHLRKDGLCCSSSEVIAAFRLLLDGSHIADARTDLSATRSLPESLKCRLHKLEVEHPVLASVLAKLIADPIEVLAAAKKQSATDLPESMECLKLAIELPQLLAYRRQGIGCFIGTGGKHLKYFGSCFHATLVVRVNRNSGLPICDVTFVDGATPETAQKLRSSVTERANMVAQKLQRHERVQQEYRKAKLRMHRPQEHGFRRQAIHSIADSKEHYGGLWERRQKKKVKDSRRRMVRCRRTSESTFRENKKRAGKGSKNCRKAEHLAAQTMPLAMNTWAHVRHVRTAHTARCLRADHQHMNQARRVALSRT